MPIMLWVVLSVMVALAAAGTAVPLVRRYDDAARDNDAVTAVLRDQLADIDVQTASGQVPAAEAEALRTELKRRLLVESRARPLAVRLLGDRSAGRIAIILPALIALAATAIYAVTGRPDLTAPPPPRVITAEVAQGNGGLANPAAAAVAPLIAQLETRMASAPGDPEGWRLLGWAYFQTQRFADAATAYRKAVALNPRGPGYASALGEALVQSAGGVVTPAARAAFVDARTVDVTDSRSRYFLALARDQAGDHKGAIDDWVRLLGEAPPGAPWAAPLRDFVERAARDAGIDLGGRLPVAPPVIAGAANARGPDAAQIAATNALPPAAQAAFVRQMVGSLAAKLKANPRDADGWIRLIRAYTVLGDVPAAKAARRDADAAFADQPATRTRFATAAAGLGAP